MNLFPKAEFINVIMYQLTLPGNFENQNILGLFL